MKIPFDIKYRPQIESGEYKVETRDGKPARILCWDKVDECGQYIVALVQYTPEHENMISVCEDGIYKGTYGHGYDLFIITPEPELSEFELTLLDWLSSDTCGEIPMDEMKKCVKNRAAELLALARKELIKEGTSKNEMGTMLYDAGFEDGKAEALKDLPRWKKLPGGIMNQVRLMNNAIIVNHHYILFSDLENLPGFNE